MIILGINYFFEHPAVALVRDGEVLFAMEDERLTRIKHGKKYTPYKTYVPYDAIGAALRYAGLRASDVDEIAVSYDRWRHLRSLWGCFTGARLSSLQEELAAFRSASNLRLALAQGYEVPYRYRDVFEAPGFSQVRVREWGHHLSHAASAFFCSGFEESLVVVADGSGEEACTSVYVGRGATLRQVAKVGLPDSLGFFYSFVTAHLGFEAFSDEYKVMGLSAYGSPVYEDALATVLKLNAGGRYSLDMRKLKGLDNLIGPPRRTGEPIEQRHRDIACSAQRVLERVLEELVRHYLRLTGMTRLCTAGGVFLNCVVNGKLANIDVVEEYFVQPAAHDAGTAIGAAALSSVLHGYPHRLRYPSMQLGTAYDDEAVLGALNEARLNYVKLESGEIATRLASLLAQEKVVALFRGRMEFGPRALGGRSLLASPIHASTREKLNLIKDREQFRPLAPLVTEEAYYRYFEGPPNRYMMLAVKATAEASAQAPAVVHADRTARAQIVRKADDPFLHETLQQFERLTGVPILVNTSLNVRGKPIDESPVDALSSYFTSGTDALLIGSYLVER